MFSLRTYGHVTFSSFLVREYLDTVLGQLVKGLKDYQANAMPRDGKNPELPKMVKVLLFTATGMRNSI